MSTIDRVRDDAGPITYVLREARLIRREIREGRFQRSMTIIAAFSAIVSGFEAYSQHIRGAFAKWLMWTPVVLTVPMVLAAAAALFSERAARRVLLPVSLVSLADGVVGFVFHLRGIARMPGSFKVGQYNIVMGPPIFAPLLLCTVGLLGAVAGLLRREELDLLLRPARDPGPPPEPPMPSPPDRPVARLEAEIAHGRFQRGMALSAAVFAVLAGGEAYFGHLRGSFNQRLMWTPVWVTPPMVAVGIGAARSKRVAQSVLPLASIVTVLEGFLGFILHLRGLHRMPGGFENLQFNVPMGPPVFAPLLFSLVGLLGFIATLLRRRRP